MEKLKKLQSYIKNPRKFIIYLEYRLERHKVFDKLSDEAFLKHKYKILFGKKPDLDNPKTFNEKLQWLKLHDRKPEYTKMVDKYEVKKYVADTLGSQYIIPTLGVWDRFQDINFDMLPNKFVLKCTHDSGGLVICKDKATFNIDKAQKKIEKSLKRNYYTNTREWPYKNVVPRIIAEEYLENAEKETNELTDYKFMCFNGKVKYIFTCTGRYSDGLKVTFFDRNWNVMPFERHYPKSKKPIPRPENLEKMIDLAEKLSEKLIFVRIDFYEVKSKIYFGEITFFPGSGMEEFIPEKWDYILGEMIHL